MKRHIVSIGAVLFLGLWATPDARAGKRTDHNSPYGDGFSPRLTVIVPTVYVESQSYPASSRYHRGRAIRAWW
jgi:hypothetical protein